MFINFSLLHPVADAREDSVMGMPVGVLRINVRFVPFAGDVTLPSPGGEIIELARKMIDFGVSMFNVLCIILVLDLVIALDVAMPSLCAIGWWTTMVGILKDTLFGAAPGIEVGVWLDADSNIWAATMTASEAITMLVSPEEALLVG